MENKKTKVAIVIVILLIIALIVVSYFYNEFNTKQMELLTGEANKILETNLTEYNTDIYVTTEKNYAKVEESIKEYISRLVNKYKEMQEIVSGINPNSIFSTSNVPDKKLEQIDIIINDYKEKSQTLIAEYEELISDEKIKANIENENITIRSDYYQELYNEIMLSEVMKNQYSKLEEEIKNEKARLYEKLNKIEKVKAFLEKNDEAWIIKEDKIQFTNINRMIEYYNLINQIID